jgi:elongation factor 1-alpha
MRPDKRNLNVAFTGHVDHGKSSLIGKLLLATGEISTREYEKYEQEAEAQNRSDATLAFISDERKEERERGLSIAPSYSRLDGSTYNFNLIDCPGHNYYTGNMIRGVSQSDATVLVISAKDGVQPLTKEHALISNVMGGDDSIVAISKMDTIDYDEARFNTVREEVKDLLATISDPADIPCVPISSTDSRNVTPDDDPIDWYDGDTLLDELNQLEAPDERTDKPLRLPVDEKHTMSGIGTTIAGTIQTGSVKSNETVIFQPSDTKCEVRSIEMFHQPLGRAIARDNVGVNLAGTTTTNVEPGDVCGSVDDPPSTAREVVTRTTAVQQPPVIKPGVKVVFHAHSLQSPCEVTEVSLSNESDSGSSKMDVLNPGDTGRIRLRFPEPKAVEAEDDFPSLSTFLLRDNNETLAYGNVTELK